MQMIADESGTLHPAVDVPVMLKCFFLTKSLTIRAPLAGSMHRFKLHDRIPIEVHLPKAPPRKAIGDPDMREHADLWCYVWRSKTKTPVEYVVRQVRLFVDLKCTLTIPQPALDRVDPSHHTKSARHDLDNVVESAEHLAEDAFRLWVRTLRWKSLNAHISQMLIEPMDVSHGAYLANLDTRKSFYSAPGIINVSGRKPITRRMWNSCGKALRDSKTPPLWLDFLFEGEHRVAASDLHGGIVSLAIACELLIRRLVMRPTNRRFFSLLKRRLVGNLLDQWSNIGPTGTRLNAAMDREKLKRLFDLRNGIMHRGEIGALKQSECRDLAKVARTFIVAGSVLGERVPPP
jgi:hypothetical protein